MVSVLEIANPEEIPKDILGAIFEKQEKLAQKYVEIEGMGDLLEKTKTNLDTTEGQVWLKDFIYRAIEEVGESFEVIADMEKSETSWDNLNDSLKIHYAEEIIDALHFFVELCIIAGIKRDFFGDLEFLGHIEHKSTIPNAFRLRHWAFVESMTMMGNTLRNKKWKQTNILTDRKKFESWLMASMDNLLRIVRAVGYTDQDIYMLYFKKNSVNQFRQRSKY